jgi:transcription elongation factor Elf1
METKKTKYTKIDHEYTDNIVCPYCGHEHIDSWEYDCNDAEAYCGGCGEEFSYERIIQINYTTRKLKQS